jgi:electron transport complex protein RnfA
VGFTVALVIMAGMREELNLAEVPNVVRGAALTLMLAGVLALGFMGFGGLGG